MDIAGVSMYESAQQNVSCSSGEMVSGLVLTIFSYLSGLEMLMLMIYRLEFKYRT